MQMLAAWSHREQFTFSVLTIAWFLKTHWMRSFLLPAGFTVSMEGDGFQVVRMESLGIIIWKNTLRSCSLSCCIVHIDGPTQSFSKRPSPWFLYRGLKEEEALSLCGSTSCFLLPHHATDQKAPVSHASRGGRTVEGHEQTEVIVTVKHAAGRVALTTFVS